MAYQQALEAAGAEVLHFEQFGSYQGDWAAIVRYNDEIGAVQGSYGSCSGCDAFEAEFGYYEGPPSVGKDGKYYSSAYEPITVGEYSQQLANHQKRLADFGAYYLAGGLYDRAHYEQALAAIDPEDYFDNERKELIEWALAHLPPAAANP